MYCGSVVVGTYGLQGLLATDPWGDSYMDAVGEYLRFILFLDDLYGGMSDRVFPKELHALISPNVPWLMAEKWLFSSQIN